jgi:hypothetical protein
MGYQNQTIQSNGESLSKYGQSGTLDTLLDIPHFMAGMGLNMANATLALKTPAAADTFIKSILHDTIYVGGEQSDINFMSEWAGRSVTRVQAKEISNRYLTKKNNNVTFTASRKDTTGAGYVWGTLSKSSHAMNGSLSQPFKGATLKNKKTQQYMVVVDENKLTDWAHEICVAPLSYGQVAEIEANQAYFVGKAASVGGVSTEVMVNDIPDIGWLQSVRFRTRRRDWKVAIDTLSGWKDELRFNIMPTSDGHLVDSWSFYQEVEARYQLRLIHSDDMLHGRPITNPSLINDNNLIPNPIFPGLPNIDSLRTGYYGLEPSIRFGGGIVYKYPQSTGFDFDRDGERIFARSNALKQTSAWLFIAGQMARFSLDRSATKLVSQQGVGSLLSEIYQKGYNKGIKYVDESGKSIDAWATSLKKWSISGYDYHGNEINIKTLNALSDVSTIGSDELSHRVYCMPLNGIKNLKTGAAMNPIEIMQFGDNGYSGDYQEFFVDQRYTDAKTPVVTGWCEQSQAVAFHGMNLTMLLEGVK